MYMPSIFNNSVFDNFDNWMDSVSYTHLDVYKRQHYVHGLSQSGY